MSHKDEIRTKRYGQWAGLPKGVSYDPQHCAAEVRDNYISRQCYKNPGHGTDGLYCKQHAKMYPYKDYGKAKEEA